jgi:hypothetical protein
VPKDSNMSEVAFPARVVAAFAEGVERADARRPQAVSTRSERVYQPGIGPHSEPATVRLVVQELANSEATKRWHITQSVPYPRSPRQKCDLVIVDGPQRWSVEVKMARFKGDNGKPADEMLMHLLSPYESDRSAVTDCVKLSRSGFPGRLAVLIYGFDYGDRPLDPAIEAFEALAHLRVRLGPRHAASFANLVHPIHQQGRVFVWEIAHDSIAKQDAMAQPLLIDLVEPDA